MGCFHFDLLFSSMYINSFVNMWLSVLFLILICFISLAFYFRKNSRAINNWLILGTLPSLLWNSNRFPDWVTEVFISLGSARGSFFIDGPIFSKLRYVVTCHPKNIEYILKTNFNNFPKGSDFKQVFSILGDGMFNVDSDAWLLQRRMAHAGFTSMEFKTLVAKMSHKVVEEQLVPFLDHVAKNRLVIDLQDVCSRFSFDSNMGVIFGRHDEKHLSIELPSNELADAFDDAQEAILYRHAMPMFLWKTLSFLGVGTEGKLSKAHLKIDLLLQQYISQKREQILNGEDTVDLLSSYIKTYDDLTKNDMFLRDSMLSLFTAGRDTIGSGLTWFFWLVSRTSSVEAKILEELKLLLYSKNITNKEIASKWPWVFDSHDLKGLVYLHAAICESLRIYPPLPLNSKSVVKEDVLPDGTPVRPGMQMIISFYSVGRMPWIWGEDCLEFKPERWIDEDGKLSFESMSKFFAFNLGPRTCLGKDISFTQMKCAIAAVLFNFHIYAVDNHVFPKPSVTLLIKDGLKVSIKKRAMKC